jgi:hypothetical protein
MTPRKADGGVGPRSRVTGTAPRPRSREQAAWRPGSPGPDPRLRATPSDPAREPGPAAHELASSPWPGGGRTRSTPRLPGRRAAPASPASARSPRCSPASGCSRARRRSPRWSLKLTRRSMPSAATAARSNRLPPHRVDQAPDQVRPRILEPDPANPPSLPSDCDARDAHSASRERRHRDHPCGCARPSHHARPRRSSGAARSIRQPFPTVRRSPRRAVAATQ